MLAYYKQGLGYLPLTKIGSRTFSALFESLGWESTQFDLLPENTVVFSHMRDPIDRHYKGTAEFLVQNQLEYLIENPDWEKVWSRAVLDIHSYPITWSLAGAVDRITWIPLGPGFPSSALTQSFLLRHGIAVPEIVTQEETQRQLKDEIYQKLKDSAKVWDRSDTIKYFYNSDIILWHKIEHQYNNFGTYYAPR